MRASMTTRTPSPRRSTLRTRPSSSMIPVNIRKISEFGFRIAFAFCLLPELAICTYTTVPFRQRTCPPLLAGQVRHLNGDFLTPTLAFTHYGHHLFENFLDRDPR